MFAICIAILAGLAAFFLVGWLQHRANAATCIKVSAPADVQARLNAAGPGKTICFSGTFTTRTGEFKPLAGQTLQGGTFRYTGSYNVTRDRAAAGKLADGFYLHATSNVTLSGMTIENFEGRGVVCGPGSRILDSTLTGNRQNAIGCIAHNANWHILIRGNTMTNNGARVLEYQSSGAVKLMELSKPGQSLGSGATVLGNIASHNIGNGIWLDRSSSATIIGDNTTNDNTHKGIRCEKCGGPMLIENNTALRNDHENISVVNSALVTLKHNTTSGSGQVGLRIDWSKVATKTYPNVGDQSLGYKVRSIVVRDRGLYHDGINGCELKGVSCSA